MFAYCCNAPVANYDPTGNYYVSAEDRITTGCGGRGGVPVSNPKPNKPNSNTKTDRKVDKLISFVRNSDEQVVLSADHITFYKGVPVIRTNGNRSGYFGAIFLTHETNYRANPEDMVRHEYGHAVQMKQLGILKYTTNIFLPSWLEWGSNPNYYSREFEVTADVLGGVTSRTHTPEDVLAGFNYLDGSARFGIIAWVTIK